MLKILALVAHTYNPSYLGSWDQEDRDLQSAQAKTLWDPILTNSWARWSVPVIPGIQEAEIGRIKVPNRPEQERFQAPHLSRKRLYAPLLSSQQWQKVWNRRTVVQACSGKKQDPISKIMPGKNGRRHGLSGRAEHLLSKHEALSSNPLPQKKSAEK
jgi:hypothetical protein